MRQLESQSGNYFTGTRDIAIGLFISIMKGIGLPGPEKSLPTTGEKQGFPGRVNNTALVGWLIVKGKRHASVSSRMEKFKKKCINKPKKTCYLNPINTSENKSL